MYLKNVFPTKKPTMRDMKFSMRRRLNIEFFRTMSCVNVFPSSRMKLSAVYLRKPNIGPLRPTTLYCVRVYSLRKLKMLYRIKITCIMFVRCQTTRRHIPEDRNFKRTTKLNKEKK